MKICIRVAAVIFAAVLLAGCTARETGEEPPSSEESSRTNFTVFQEEEPLQEEPESQPAQEETEDLLLPLVRSGIVFYSWETPSQIEGVGLGYFGFLKLAQQNDMEQYKDAQTGMYHIPCSLLEEQVMKYFDIPREQIREGYNWYQPDVDYYEADAAPDFGNTIRMIGQKETEDALTADFYVADKSGRILREVRLTLQKEGKEYRYASCHSVNRDYYGNCISMDIALLGDDELIFEKSTDIPSKQLFAFAMYIINQEGIQRENWEAWQGNIPLDVIEQALSCYLGEVYFDPEEIENYDPQNQVFTGRMIGGFGGARNARIVSEDQAENVLTLVLDFCDMQDDNKVYYTKTYKIQINGESYQYLSIAKQMPEN